MKDPKRPERKLEVAGTELEIMHTGGFVRLYHIRCRLYWLIQNQYEHRTPDWKLHFSVELDDVPKAWNLLAALFMKFQLHTGMKAYYAPKETWRPGQRGREITVYLYTHHSIYGTGPQPELAELGPEHELSSERVSEFVLRAEELLAKHKIRPRGCAAGDLKLGRYSSLRNEAFVAKKQEVSPSKFTTVFEYPSNQAGWNAQGHYCPLNWRRLRFRLWYSGFS